MKDSVTQDMSSESWPALSFEDRPWTTSSDALASRNELRQHRGPYRAAIAPSIAERTLQFDSSLLAKIEDATTEISRFDAQQTTEVAPLAALLLRSESAASSQIENLTASATAIASAELGDRRKQNASIIVANTRAMTAAIDLANHLDEDSIISMHEALLAETHPEWVGHWRTEQVWIGGSRIGPHQADYVAPHHDRVPAAMSDLVAFMDRDDLPVLAQTALAHAQFETIHPFPDGNGRVGRALVHSMLRAKGVTRSVTVPISAGLLGSRDAYFAALEAYRDGEPRFIVEAFADATFAALSNGRKLTADLRAIRDSWEERIVARSHATAWRVADLLTRQPVVNSTFVQSELAVSEPTATAAITALVDAGVLSQIGNGRRYRTWSAPEVLTALDDFAQRARRRQG